MELDQATQDILDDVKQSVTAIRSGSERRDRDVADLKSRVDAMAFTGGGFSGGAHGEHRAFTFPSMREYRDLETRAQRTGSDPAGGYLVQEEVGAFHDRMRASNVILAAGPRIVDMTSDAMVLPGLSGSTTVYTPGEAGSITESDATFQQVRLTARKYIARTVASSEWLSDANPAAREIIADDHARQLANRLDLDMLEGNATMILGLRRKAGVTATELGAGNGLAPTLDDLGAALYRLEADNADMTRVAIFMHPRTWQTFAKLKDLQNRYLIQPDPTSEARRSLFGRPVFVSSQIAITETVGSSSDCSYIIAADMSRVVVGRRLDLTVLYDPFSKSSTDQVVIQSTVRYDMNVLHTGACEVITGVRP
jgi:HK97 family phage major capsid protein